MVEYGIVKHHYQLAIVRESQVAVHRLKAGTERRVIQQLAVMVAFDQDLATIESMHDSHSVHSRQKRHITQHIHSVVLTHQLVPFRDHGFAHVLYIAKSATSFGAKLLDVGMPKMQI
jgi:hypothetical protein